MDPIIMGLEQRPGKLLNIRQLPDPTPEDIQRLDNALLDIINFKAHYGVFPDRMRIRGLVSDARGALS